MQVLVGSISSGPTICARTIIEQGRAAIKAEGGRIIRPYRHLPFVVAIVDPEAATVLRRNPLVSWSGNTASGRSRIGGATHNRFRVDRPNSFKTPGDVALNESGARMRVQSNRYPIGCNCRVDPVVGLVVVGRLIQGHRQRVRCNLRLTIVLGVDPFRWTVSHLGIQAA